MPYKSRSCASYTTFGEDATLCKTALNTCLLILLIFIIVIVTAAIIYLVFNPPVKAPSGTESSSEATESSEETESSESEGTESEGGESEGTEPEGTEEEDITKPTKSEKEEQTGASKAGGGDGKPTAPTEQKPGGGVVTEETEPIGEDPGEEAKETPPSIFDKRSKQLSKWSGWWQQRPHQRSFAYDVDNENRDVDSVRGR